MQDLGASAAGAPPHVHLLRVQCAARQPIPFLSYLQSLDFLSANLKLSTTFRSHQVDLAKLYPYSLSTR